ncbi:hypothetical protein J31TS4_29090 [Paenibacillus sp. J31TS4]|uniref:S8 family peptidase n=1 Tax=Paenibacillus sp. J31TS4 TaxID=2807195 RepID=UPI001AFDC41E|nr:S8 family peptidase [Paenibacillus sp. J31TS4]GIP39629.1 hypothetical protein J31TS4_29090 [Paenibacillus sp. J31TS4]
MSRRMQMVLYGLLAVFLVLPLGYVLFRSPSSQAPTRPTELSAKQRLVAQDVKRTDELCRIQCAADFRSTASALSTRGTAGGQAEQELARLQQLYPHMDRLIWTKRGEQLGAGVRVGSLPPAAEQAAAPLLAKAKAEAERGKEYQSASFGQGSERYFVLGVPAANGAAALVGVIHQDILHQVTGHQEVNLRTVPYPVGKNWKVESVDANTRTQKPVTHPEDNGTTSHYHRNEVVVKFKQPPTEEQLKSIQRDIRSEAPRKLGYTYVFTSATMEAEALKSYFMKWNIEYAEPHFLYLTNERSAAPAPDQVPAGNAGNGPVPVNDALYEKYQWNLPIIETDLGWEVGTGSTDVPVGIVDTGVDLDHPDLQGRLLSGVNLVDKSAPPRDDVGHGTHVAGVIAALTNNGQGVAGMTWSNPILPVKVLDSSGAGSTYAVAQGIIWATDHGAKVINLSLGNYADAEFLHDAVRYAYDHDVVLVAASGNDNTEQPGYPAAYPEVFAVAATDADKQKASFSNYGDYIDVAAPGVSIASTYPGNRYAALSGTSMASPHVAALAALVRSVNPLLKNTEVMEIMRSSAQDIGTPGRDASFGYGQIDVARALQQARESRQAVANWPEWLQRDLARIEASYR